MKSELKDGHLVKLRNGDVYVYMEGTLIKRYVTDVFIHITEYDDVLRHNRKNVLDVVKLFNSFNSDEIRAEPQFEDKQLVWCWDNGYTHIRVLGFYNKQDGSVFSTSGGRKGVRYDNYEAYEGVMPKWAIKAYRRLED